MKYKLECYVARPTASSIGSESFPNDVALLLGTPVASRIDTDGDTLSGDTGVRAQALANKLGSKVVAWQDLGPKVRFPGLLAARRRLTGHNLAEYAHESAQAITDILNANDIGRVVMRVHSGTGPVGTELAIALHRENDLAVSHLAVSDPVGLQAMSFLQGWRRVQAYNNGPAKQTPQEHRNDPLHPSNAFTAFLSDVAVRGTTTWLSDITYRNLLDIGNNQPDTAVLLHLPGNTLNGPITEAQALAADIQSRVKRPDGTFVVAFEPDHYHSSEYDNLDRNVDFIRRTVALSSLS